MNKTIRSIGGGSGSGSGTSTVVIGPDYGAPNQAVEAHLASSFAASVAYPMTEELSLRPTTFTQSYSGPTEELHMGGTVIGPPQFESIVTGKTSASSSIAINGMSTIVGQVLVGIIGNTGAANTIATPSGFTLIRKFANTGSGGAGGNMGAFYRVILAGDASSMTFTYANSAAACSAVAAFSGVDTTTPVSVSAQSTGQSTAVTIPSVTPTSINSMLVAGFGQTISALSAAFVMPTGWVSRSTQEAAGALTNCEFGIATHVQASSGASGSFIVNTGETVPTAVACQGVNLALNAANRVIA